MYEFELPIYYTYKYNKKLKTSLVGMNLYRNMHYHASNKMKKHFHNLVSSILGTCEDEPYKMYRVKYKLFYKDARCDLMNVISVIDKFVNDSIQELGYVKNDNVKFYKKCFIEVAEQDKENPRVEIIIEELD